MRRPSPTRIYVGREHAVYAVGATTVERLRAGSGPASAWGPAASEGPVSLALAHTLLADAGGGGAAPSPTPAAARRFAGEILCRLPADGFVLDASVVRRWLTHAVTV